MKMTVGAISVIIATILGADLFFQPEKNPLIPYLIWLNTKKPDDAVFWL